MNRIITLHANQNQVNYYSCVVSEQTFENLSDLSLIGGFKRFSIDYEDDTTKERTEYEDIYKYFLSYVLGDNKKEQVIEYLGF